MALGDVISEAITTLAEPPAEDGWAPVVLTGVAVSVASLTAVFGTRFR